MAKRSRKDRRNSIGDRQERSAQEMGKGRGGIGVLDLSEFEEVKFCKPKEGTNVYDIIPWEITESWYAKLRSLSGNPIGKEVGDLEYKLEIPVHKNVGAENKTVICLRLAFGKRCPICDERDATEDAKLKEDLKPKWRCIYNIVDHADEEEERIQIFDVSYYLFEKELLDEATSSAEGGEIISYSHPDNGHSIKFRAKKKNFKTYTFLEYKSIDFKERDPLDDELIDKAYPLDKMLSILEHDEIQRIFLELEDEDQDQPTKSKEAKKRTPTVNDNDDDIPLNVGKEKEKEIECPHDLKLGDDFDQYDVCDDCDHRESCKESGVEEKPKPKSSPKPTPKPKSKKQDDDNQCPCEHQFGTDFNKEDDCENCPEDSFDSCGAASENIKKEKPKKTRK